MVNNVELIESKSWVKDHAWLVLCFIDLFNLFLGGLWAAALEQTGVILQLEDSSVDQNGETADGGVEWGSLDWHVKGCCGQDWHYDLEHSNV